MGRRGKTATTGTSLLWRNSTEHLQLEIPTTQIEDQVGGHHIYYHHYGDRYNSWVGRPNSQDLGQAAATVAPPSDSSSFLSSSMDNNVTVNHRQPLASSADELPIRARIIVESIAGFKLAFA
jgi:hypothetical protein